MVAVVTGAAGMEFQGRTFKHPAPVAGIDGDSRVALGWLTGGAVRSGRDLVEDAMQPGAVDLGRVGTGRCPLLVGHLRTVDSLIGAVVAAEQRGPVLVVAARFARGPEADRLWAMLRDGFPLSLSFGARVEHAELVEDRGDHRVIRVARWRLDEVSVVVFGADEAAHLRRFGDGEDAAEAVARMAAAAGGAARAGVSAALHLDRWRGWSTWAGVRLAGRLGVDRDTCCDALDAEVAAHCEQLIADLAA
jgi:hypothetical protein